MPAYLGRIREKETCPPLQHTLWFVEVACATVFFQGAHLNWKSPNLRDQLISTIHKQKNKGRHKSISGLVKALDISGLKDIQIDNIAEVLVSGHITNI